MAIIKTTTWHEQSIDAQIVLELGITNVFGVLDRLDKDTLAVIKSYMYEVKKNGSQGQFYVSSEDLDIDYKVVYMSRPHGEVWKTLPPASTFNDDKPVGIILADPEEVFVTWIERKKWIQEFMAQLRARLNKAGKSRKDVKVFVKIFDAAAIPELYTMVDGIMIYPLNGVIFQGRFVLPMGGYLDLMNEQAAENVREVIDDVGKLLNVTQKGDEPYDRFVKRLQCHVFNFAIELAKFINAGGNMEDFSYNRVGVDLERVYDLAVIRGVRGDIEMTDLAQITELEIENSIKSRDVTPMLKTFSRILAISISRVEFGQRIDNANRMISKNITEEIRTSLTYVDKLAAHVAAARKAKFDEKVAIKKLQQEQEKIDIAKRAAPPPNNAGELGQQATAIGMVMEMEGIDAQQFLGEGKKEDDKEQK